MIQMILTFIENLPDQNRFLWALFVMSMVMVISVGLWTSWRLLNKMLRKGS